MERRHETTSQQCHTDRSLTAEQLDDKYNPDGDGEHPMYTRWDWLQVVAQRSTLSGYWCWVVCQIEEENFTQI